VRRQQPQPPLSRGESMVSVRLIDRIRFLAFIMRNYSRSFPSVMGTTPLPAARAIFFSN
jgi:hypothetical protein